MDSKVLLFYLFFIATLVNCEYKSYKDFKVYNIVPNSNEELQVLKDLKKDEGFDFWTDTFLPGKEVKIMVSPQRQDEFVNYLKAAGISAEVGIVDIQKLIDRESNSRSNNTAARQSVIGTMSWDKYYTVDEIYAWLHAVRNAYPRIVTIINIGKSTENRDLLGIEINFRHEENPVIGMFEGGIHAREWISPATVTWIINEFLTSNNPSIRYLAENVVWHLFPVLNPDGYVYSFSHDRLWRKTRNTANFIQCANGPDDSSNGVDLNRNFGFLWMQTGASSDPCQQTYAGPKAFSEPESEAIRDYVHELNKQGRLMYYFAMHSFSQMVLVPYSHVSGRDVLDVKNYADMFEIAIRGMDALEKRFGTDYRVGTSKEILYEVTGTSFDWVKEYGKVPIVYCFELRDKGEHGFILPAEMIIDNNLEVMDSLVEMDRIARDIGYYEGHSSGCITIASIALLLSVISLRIFL